ncbi:glycosyltransferase [Patescibacteria group bacterium]|nr:glycosyltransferase [Patescibacteria group bacterium]
MSKVSIILPTYNGHRFINRAIESVFSQTFVDWELVIIDDGSEPAIKLVIDKKYLSDPRVKVLENKENLGIQKSLNKGLRESNGEYIARLDDDDWWNCNNKLFKQIDLLDSKSDVGICGTGAVFVNEEGKELFKYQPNETDKEIRSLILKKNPYIHASVMFRKKLVLDLGGYDESKETLHLEDYDLWLRLGVKAEFASVRHSCTSFFLGSGGISSKFKKEQLIRNTQLIKKYGKQYPRYFKYLAYSYARNFLYSLYNLMPSGIKTKLFAIYKRN